MTSKIIFYLMRTYNSLRRNPAMIFCFHKVYFLCFKWEQITLNICVHVFYKLIIANFTSDLNHKWKQYIPFNLIHIVSRNRNSNDITRFDLLHYIIDHSLYSKCHAGDVSLHKWQLGMTLWWWHLFDTFVHGKAQFTLETLLLLCCGPWTTW